MCAVRAVLFDLDGTLTQSEEGIWNCVRYAAEKMGRPAPDAETLRRFIGPPLFFSFQTYMSMTEEEAGRAVDFYRERYNVTGLLENRVYPGIRRLLVRLKRAGCYLGIAHREAADPHGTDSGGTSAWRASLTRWPEPGRRIPPPARSS